MLSLCSIPATHLDSPFLIPSEFSPSHSSGSSDVHIPQYPKKTGKWTIEEDDLLRKYVDIHGEKQWQKICLHIPGRTSIQCLHRWSKILKPGLVKGPWTQEEDEKLTNWVKNEGPNKWALAANIIIGRSGKQCRERWFNNLDPEIKKGEWSKEEDELVFDLYKKYGSSWSKIAKFVKGRTENSIKNRFYSTLRKLTSDKKKNSFKSVFASCFQGNDDEMEEETASKTTTCEASSAEQTPHTLYKLLKDSAIVNDKDDQVEQDQEDSKSDKTKKFMAKRGASNSSGNSELSFPVESQTKQNENGLNGLFKGQMGLFNKESPFAARQEQMFMSPLGNKMSFGHLETGNLFTKLRHNAPENVIANNYEIPQLGLFNQFGSPQNRNPQYCQNNMQGLVNNLPVLNSINTSPLSAYKTPNRDFQIPSLGSLPSSSKKDLSNPVEIRYEDTGRAMQVERPNIPKLPPLQIPLNPQTRNLEIQEALRLSQRNSIFGLNNNTSYNMGLPIRIENNFAQEKMNAASLIEYFQELQSRKEMSQESQTSLIEGFNNLNNSPLKYGLEGKNELLMAMRSNLHQVSNIQNGLIKGLLTRQPDQQNETKMNMIYNQLHSLENMFSNVKNQLNRLENTIKPQNNNFVRRGDLGMRMEVGHNHHRHHDKRSYAEALQRGNEMENEMYLVDSLYKKVKVE